MSRLRDLLVDGVLLALPLVAAAFLLHKVFGLLLRLLAPVSRLMPPGRWLGVAAGEIVAIAVLLLVLVALGAVARSAIGRRVAGTLENVVLGKIPGYMIVKSIAADFTGSEQQTGMQPALISFDDNTVLGFIVEESAAADAFTVFLPGAPGAASGSVVLMPRERVRVLDVPTGSAIRAMKQRGIGLQRLTKGSSPGSSPK